jgi:hypothetical protein
MISAPDTPFGRAFLAYIALYTHRPLDLELLHAQYAALAALATQEHPLMPWPLLLDDTPPCSFSVEDLLARERGPYARMPLLDPAHVTRTVARWQGARVKQVVAGGGMRYLFDLQVIRRAHPRQPKLRGRKSGWLRISCSWQLGLPHPCSSREAEERVVASLSALQGATLETIDVAATGGLGLTFSTGARLQVQPDGLRSSPDYQLDLGHHPYFCYAGTFRVEHPRP